MKLVLSILVILSVLSFTLSNGSLDHIAEGEVGIRVFEPSYVEEPTMDSRIDLTTLFPAGNTKYFNTRGARQLAWGSRSVDMARFQNIQDPGNPSRWIAYFHEETIVPVLQTPDRYMLDCTVIEVKKDTEQREAMEDLGAVMELAVINLKDMITLIKLCGSIHPLLTNLHETHHTEEPESIKLTPGAMVLPGTLWCGVRDIARSYEDIGDKAELDKCCRDHDHCPIKLGTFETRYGVSNFGLATRSHCACDREFYRCLKASRDQTAGAVGDFYFNVLQLRCVEEKTIKKRERENLKVPLYSCLRTDREGRCRMWKKNINYPLFLETKRPMERF